MRAWIAIRGSKGRYENLKKDCCWISERQWQTNREARIRCTWRVRPCTECNQPTISSLRKMEWNNSHLNGMPSTLHISSIHLVVLLLHKSQSFFLIITLIISSGLDRLTLVGSFDLPASTSRTTLACISAIGMIEPYGWIENIWSELNVIIPESVQWCQVCRVHRRVGRCTQRDPLGCLSPERIHNWLFTHSGLTVTSSPLSRMGNSNEYPVATITVSTSSTFVPSSNSNPFSVNCVICGLILIVPAAIRFGSSSLTVGWALKWICTFSLVISSN